MKQEASKARWKQFATSRVAKTGFAPSIDVIFEVSWIFEAVAC